MCDRFLNALGERVLITNLTNHLRFFNYIGIPVARPQRQRYAFEFLKGLSLLTFVRGFMSEAPVFDKAIKNVRVVRPNEQSVERLDLGIKNGKFALIAPEISPEQALDVFDA